MEDSENVGADEDQDMSQDDTADDEEVDDTVIAHVKHQGYVIFDFAGSTSNVINSP